MKQEGEKGFGSGLALVMPLALASCGGNDGCAPANDGCAASGAVKG